MKLNILVACAFSILAQVSFAQETALITKINGSGFTSADDARTETCEVFLNKVVITQKYGAYGEQSFTTQEVRRVKLSNSIRNVIQSVAKEDVSKSDNLLCDGPSTKVSSSLAGETIDLFVTGGCGSPRIERNGSQVRMLLDLVSTYCPVTHDFGVQNTNL
ncbi:MAG: hypothetical protein M3Q07_06045 [Pseudobdellovibrionaceae bacterium]|nr:hypothetical protein [Pseudobdellovibrionaceae bacterium]